MIFFSAYSLACQLILLFAAHALCDYPLQGDFLSRGKMRNVENPVAPWWVCLTAHAFIHAGAVLLITHSLLLALAELLLHWLIDWHKGLSRHGFVTDQALHLGCKVVWACAAATVLL